MRTIPQKINPTAEQTTPSSNIKEPQFQLSQVITISFGHFVHDLFGSAFLPALLPILRTRLSIGYADAGLLVFFSQLPNILNPVFGYLADKVSLRYGVIFAPAVTATLIGAIGLTNSYTTLAFLLLCAGVSIASFHAPAPPLAAQISGERVGMGMGIFMFGGEIARTLGPLAAIGAVSWVGLEGMWRLMFFGWLTSFFLFIKLRHVSPTPSAANQVGIKQFWAPARRIFPALALITLLRSPLLVAITVYLPIFVSDERQSTLFIAAGALTILEGAGALGVVFTGTMSDWLGRKPILFLLFFIAPWMLLGFLYGPSWMAIPFLVMLGLTAITPMPVLMSIVQEHFPDNRAFANGIFMTLNFGFRGIAIWLVGRLADSSGLNSAFLWSGLLAFLSVPVLLWLPNLSND